jgi:hypothetical protein
MNRSIRPVFMLCIGAAALLVTMAAWASITGTISGVLSDPTGAVVPRLTAIATNEATGVQSTTVTDAKGFYSFPALAVGKYDVVFSNQGFEIFETTGSRSTSTPRSASTSSRKLAL